MIVINDMELEGAKLRFKAKVPDPGSRVLYFIPGAAEPSVSNCSQMSWREDVDPKWTTFLLVLNRYPHVGRKESATANTVRWHKYLIHHQRPANHLDSQICLGESTQSDLFIQRLKLCRAVVLVV